jgi:hypothetical protein
VIYKDKTKKVKLPRDLEHNLAIFWLAKSVFKQRDPSGFEVYFGTSVHVADWKDDPEETYLELVYVQWASSALFQASLRILYFLSDDGIRVRERDTALLPKSATVDDLLGMVAQRFQDGPLRAFRCTGSGKIRRLLVNNEYIGYQNCFRIEVIPDMHDEASPSELMPVDYQSGDKQTIISFVLLVKQGELFQTTKPKINAILMPYLDSEGINGLSYSYKVLGQFFVTPLHDADSLYQIFNDKHKKAILVVRPKREHEPDSTHRNRPSSSIRIHN